MFGYYNCSCSYTLSSIQDRFVSLTSTVVPAHVDLLIVCVSVVGHPLDSDEEPGNMH